MHEMHNSSKEKAPASCGGPAGRKFVRYPVSLRCEFTSDPYSGNGHVVDVSTGGCKIEAEWDCTPGAYVSMTLHVLAPDRAISVELAVVRWSSGRNFGVEFIRMHPLQQERLRLLVGYIEKDSVQWTALDLNDGAAAGA